MTAFCVTDIKPNVKCLLVDKQSHVVAAKCLRLTVADGGRKWLQFEVKMGDSAKQELFQGRKRSES